MKSIKRKGSLAALAACNRVRELIKDKRGISGIVEVIGLIIVVVVILAVVFFPQIKSWFGTTMTSLGGSTSKLFSLT